MLKSEIKALLKELNQNDEINWDVTTNRKNLVVITNDYCESDFLIKADEDNTISIEDVNMEETICYLFHDKYFQDYTDHEDEIKKAIKNLVSYFYHVY